jgi:phosphoglycolate phosphatase-like HAD superfamily hydrolase
MSLRIAFDCDGVVADLDSALTELVTRLFGEAQPQEAPEATEAAAPGPSTTASPESAAAPAGAAATSSSGEPSAAEASTPGEDTPPPAAEALTPGGEAPAPPSEAPAQDGPTEEEIQAAPARFRTLSRRQQHDLWEAVRNTENFWESLDETEPGIVARLARLARERRWEVIFITQRPASAGDTTQLQTQRWLSAHGFELPSVYVIKGTRGKVAEALSLDVVVDDRPDNCLDVKLESRARAVLVWADDLASLPPNARRLGIEPVASLGEGLDLLSDVPAGKPGLLQRIRQLIGA